MSKAAELANLIGNINAGGGGTNKNLLINGNCAVAQRGDQSSKSSDHYSAVDRFEIQMSGSGAVTSTQSTTVPTGKGFNNSLKVDVVTNNGGSEDSGDYLLIMQKIEGLNLQQLKYGTSSAVPLACSFYVRSNLTGTFQFQIEVPDSGSYKYYGKTYTINSANTWEKKTINIVANTNSSAIPDDNTEGLRVQWQLVGGSNYTSGTYTDEAWHGTGGNRLSSSVNNTFARSTDNEFLLTGVQLEVGQNPTEFEHEPFERTLSKCQRYLLRYPNDGGTNGGFTRYGTGQIVASNEAEISIYPPVHMRVDPSLSIGGSASDYYIWNANDADSCSALTVEGGSTHEYIVVNCVGSGMTAGRGCMLNAYSNDTNFLQFDAEL